jgi:uncharacterized protein involved in exopolysaccharide biosynthesis
MPMLRNKWPSEIARALRLISNGLSFVAGLALALIYTSIKSPRLIGRYLASAVATIIVIFSVAFAYLAVATEKYTSRWTFILPTSSSAVSLNVESIGHAQSTPSSPFGSSAISPKVIYKEIADSEVVRQTAARSLGLSLGEFGRPRIKLVDETALINFEIQGPTAKAAQDRANALIEAFNQHLDRLRADEIQKRADVVKSSLGEYNSALQAARDKVLTLQGKTGLLTINQFNEAASTLELLRRRLTEVRSELLRLNSEQEVLVARIGIAPNQAAIALKIASDPSNAKLISEFSEARALYQKNAPRLGPENPIFIETKRHIQGVAAELSRVAQLSEVHSESELRSLLMLASGTQQAEFFKTLVQNESLIQGRRSEIQALENELEQLSANVQSMSASAAQLEDLKRDHLVAEAVFTSALARLDTNKVDIYASYPMVQTLAQPDLPYAPSSPNYLLIIAAALAASLISTIGWGLAWVRTIFTPRRLKRRSSIG